MAKIKPVTNPCVLPDSIEGQVVKIAEEFNELLNAIFDKDLEHADEEAMDIMISCRTYFHKRGYTDEEVDELYNKVEQKNAKRGYYMPDTSIKAPNIGPFKVMNKICEDFFDSSVTRKAEQ